MIENGTYKHLIGEYVSTCLIGDYFSVENYIDIQPLDLDTFCNKFYIKLFD
jgi:hypothetical protein